MSNLIIGFSSYWKVWKLLSWEIWKKKVLSMRLKILLSTQISRKMWFFILLNGGKSNFLHYLTNVYLMAFTHRNQCFCQYPYSFPFVTSQFYFVTNLQARISLNQNSMLFKSPVKGSKYPKILETIRIWPD